MSVRSIQPLSDPRKTWQTQAVERIFTDFRVEPLGGVGHLSLCIFGADLRRCSYISAIPANAGIRAKGVQGQENQQMGPRLSPRRKPPWGAPGRRIFQCFHNRLLAKCKPTNRSHTAFAPSFSRSSVGWNLPVCPLTVLYRCCIWLKRGSRG